LGVEGDGLGHLACAEAIEQGIPARRQGVREAAERPVRILEHGARADEASFREQRGADAALRRPARVQPLGPGAFGEILDDAGGETAGDAERVGDLRGR
jgi:hypothetical protein